MAFSDASDSTSVSVKSPCLSAGNMLGIVLLAVFFSVLFFSVRRLYLHPLKSFPGPALAALTTWYCGYYDVIKHGALLRHITKLHQQYGEYSVVIFLSICY